MNETTANQKLLRTIFLHKKSILLISIMLSLLAIGITSFLDKKYAATGIVYPTKSNQMKNVAGDPDFGYQIHTERLIQIFRSQKMRQEMVRRFDLINYYEIDTLNANWFHTLKHNFEKDVTFTKTEYLSVEIKAEFKDPILAASVVNNMISYVDTIRRNIFLANTQIWVNDLKGKIEPQQKIVDSLLLEVFNSNTPNAQSTLANNTIASIDNRKKNATTLMGDDVIKAAIEKNYSIKLERLISEYYMELGILNRYQSDLIQGQEKLSLPFPKIFTIMQAEVDNKKIFPSYKNAAVIAFLLGFMLSTLYFSLKDNYRNLISDLNG